MIVIDLLVTITFLQNLYPSFAFCNHTEKGHFCTGELLPNESVQNLVLSNYPGQYFNLSALQTYQELESFTLIQSPAVRQLIGIWPNVSEIHLNNLSIESIQIDFVFPNVQILDVRNNNLKIIPSDLTDSLPNLRMLFIGNNPIHCTNETWESMGWMWENIAIADLKNVTCAKSGPLYNRKPLKLILGFIKSAIDTCPHGCSCILPHVVNDPKKGLTPLITVNCQNLNLTSIPLNIPINTTTIHLESNRISSLQPLIDNPAYLSVVDVFLDNNQVTTIDNLEGSFWLANFRILSLRFNQLQSIPTYALDNALEKNHHVSRLFLGNNPWICECSFTPGLQVLILKYQSYIKDIDDLYCKVSYENGMVLIPVRSISLTDVCKATSFASDPLLILNWIFIFLIVLIFTKLGYDYYFYKKSGKLPWIAMKIP